MKKFNADRHVISEIFLELCIMLQATEPKVGKIHTPPCLNMEITCSVPPSFYSSTYQVINSNKNKSILK